MFPRCLGQLKLNLKVKDEVEMTARELLEAVEALAAEHPPDPASDLARARVGAARREREPAVEYAGKTDDQPRAPGRALVERQLCQLPHAD